MFHARVLLPFAVLATLFVPWAGAAAGETIRGSRVVTSETRPIGGFPGIALDVPASVTLRQGEREGVTITGDDNVVPLVETVVERGTLRIRWARRGGYTVDFESLDIVVDARTIDALAVRGAGRIRAAGLKAGDLQATVDGSGRIVCETLDADSLKVAIHGNGRFAAGGRAGSLDATLAGSGELEAAKLESRRVRVMLNGSARATVWADDALSAAIAGSGEVRYYGKPRVSQTVAGSGRIRPAADAS
ncbi:MAG TPA: head GIN domain-containing protein [Casimicrobiaceae bacterium]|nr:head GIN domain-containing protein [Casimicrobiaceae bacterium]